MNRARPEAPATGPRPQRTRWLIAAVAGAVIVAAAASVLWARWNAAGAPQLSGAVLTPPVTAYDFQLSDQHDRTISLSGLRGKVVALTFLYTHCPDVCPLIADHMRITRELLGPAAAHAAFVAVSVDPNGDTPAAIRTFLAKHRVEGILTYLHGSFAQLKPIWAHYYVGSDAKQVNPQAAGASAPTPEQLNHTAIVYVIDPQGKIRAFLGGNFDPHDLATDIRALAGR
jgi:protein SCO1/2